jgi:YfiH family protein
MHVGDDPKLVAHNRLLLKQILPSTPAWLNQVQGTKVVKAEEIQGNPVEADAAVTRKSGVVPVILTADCLPVLFCDRAGTVVAAAHAGWRGLCDGVLENTLAAMECSPQDIYAWLGPAIGPTAFEVGEEVRTAFIAHDPQASLAFVPAKQEGKWLGNLYLLARQRLNTALVASITGGEYCTYTEEAAFFSYRRDKVCGRMATLIWLA